MAYKKSYKKRSYRKYRGKPYRKRAMRRFQKKVKRVILKTAETKYYMAASEQNYLYHDRGTSGAGALTSNEGAVVFNPWNNITKGTSISQRIGDEIYPRGMSMRIAVWTRPGRPAQFVRFIVAVIPKVVGTTIMDGTNFDLMDQAGSNDTVTGMIKKEGVKVLYDRMVNLTCPSNDTATCTFGINRIFKKIYIKSKRGGKLTWGQDGYMTNKPVGVWVIPYDNYAALRTDWIAETSFTYKLYFKDV